MGLEVFQCIHVQLQSFVVVAGIVLFHGLFDVLDRLLLEVRVHGALLPSSGRQKDRFGRDAAAPVRLTRTRGALVGRMASSSCFSHVGNGVGAPSGSIRDRKGGLDRKVVSKGPFQPRWRRDGIPGVQEGTRSRPMDEWRSRRMVDRQPWRIWNGHRTCRCGRKGRERRIWRPMVRSRIERDPQGPGRMGGEEVGLGLEDRCRWMLGRASHRNVRRMPSSITFEWRHSSATVWIGAHVLRGPATIPFGSRHRPLPSRHRFQKDANIHHRCFTQVTSLPSCRLRILPVVTNETSGLGLGTIRLCDPARRFSETGATLLRNPVVPSRGRTSRRRGMRPPPCPSKLSARWKTLPPPRRILTTRRRLHNCSRTPDHFAETARARKKRAHPETNSSPQSCMVQENNGSCSETRDTPTEIIGPTDKRTTRDLPLPILAVGQRRQSSSVGPLPSTTTLRQKNTM